MDAVSINAMTRIIKAEALKLPADKLAAFKKRQTVRCSSCPYKLNFKKDRAFITMLFQSGVKERIIHLGFVCPKCVTLTTTQWKTDAPADAWLDYMNIYVHK